PSRTLRHAPLKKASQTPQAAARRTEKRDGGRVAAPPSHEEKKRADAAARRQQRAEQSRRQAIEQLEKEIADCESAIKSLEQEMSAAGFYENRDAAQPVIERHQALMWKVGDLMHKWEELQTASSTSRP